MVAADTQDELKALWVAGVPLDVSWIENAPQEERNLLEAARLGDEYDDYEERRSKHLQMLTLLREGAVVAVGRRADDPVLFERVMPGGCYENYVQFHKNSVSGGNQDLTHVMVFLGERTLQTGSDRILPPVQSRGLSPYQQVFDDVAERVKASEHRLKGRMPFAPRFLKALRVLLIDEQESIHLQTQGVAIRRILDVCGEGELAKLFEKPPVGETVRLFIVRYCVGWHQ